MTIWERSDPELNQQIQQSFKCDDVVFGAPPDSPVSEYEDDLPSDEDPFQLEIDLSQRDVSLEHLDNDLELAEATSITEHVESPRASTMPGFFVLPGIEMIMPEILRSRTTSPVKESSDPQTVDQNPERLT